MSLQTLGEPGYADRTADLGETVEPPEPRRLTRGGPADIAYVLCLLQVGFTLLAALGEELLMGGNPAYLVVPLVKSVLLLVVATKLVSGRRWALVTLIVLQSLTVAAFWLQLAASLIPGLGLTLNLVGLATNLVMPLAIIFLCAELLRRRVLGRPTAGHADLPGAGGPGVAA
jgi:hypothetical protein